MKRILIAGGFGRLGSRAVERLLEKGYQVTVIDNMSGQRRKNVKEIADKVTLVQDDISKLRPIDQEFDYVWHIAGAAQKADWEKDPVGIILPNSMGSINLINIALKNNARYFYTSSSEAYGNPTIVPTPETHVSAMNHLGPRAAYDESKKFGEVIAKAYERQHGLKSVSVRLFNPYGPHMGRIVDIFVQLALENKEIPVDGDGSQTRSFCYMSDLVEGMITVLEKGQIGEVYNVGNSKEERSILELANLVKKMTNSSSKIVFNKRPPSDPDRRCPDVSKIKTLGWEPKVSLEEGVAKIIEEYKKN